MNGDLRLVTVTNVNTFSKIKLIVCRFVLGDGALCVCVKCIRVRASERASERVSARVLGCAMIARNRLLHKLDVFGIHILWMLAYFTLFPFILWIYMRKYHSSKLHCKFLRTTIRKMTCKNNIYLHGKMHILAAVNHLFSRSCSSSFFLFLFFVFSVCVDWLPAKFRFMLWVLYLCVLLWSHEFRHQKLSKPEYFGAVSHHVPLFSRPKSGWVRIFCERNAFKCDKFMVVNALQNCNVSNDSQARCFDRQVVCFFNT